MLNSLFNHIEICIKDQNNRPVNMKDFFQISQSILLKNIYEKIRKNFSMILICN